MKQDVIISIIGSMDVDNPVGEPDWDDADVEIN